MSDVQESYPLPTSGEATVVKVALSGTGILNMLSASGSAPGTGDGTSWVYDVTLSLTATGHASSVAVTAQANDIDDESASYSGTYNWICRNAKPVAANSGDVVESYPASTSGVFANIASFNSSVSVAAVTSTANPPTVYAHKLGEALVEVFVPFGDVDGTDAEDLTDGILNGAYAQLRVHVVA
jgi:hypothetical protein